jgi:hypothetical protein
MYSLLQQPAETSAYTTHHGVTSHRLLLVTPVRTSNPNWIQTDEMNLSLFAPIALFFTLCFLPSFVRFCFPSLLSSHIHPFIVAEHWLSSSPSRTPPPFPTFFHFIFCVPSLLQEGLPDARPYGWHFYFALTNLWPRHVWLLTYTSWRLYSIGKLNLKFNQQNYVTFFWSANESRPPFVARPITWEKMCQKGHPGKLDG